MTELNDDTIWIMSRPKSWCRPIAKKLREQGAEIPCRAESEEAHVIHWLIMHYEADPEKWRENAEAELSEAATEGPSKTDSKEVSG